MTNIIRGEVKFIGDAYPGAYACGLSMLDSDTMKRFTKAESDLSTEYISDDGVKLIVKKSKGKKENVTVVNTSIVNNSSSEYIMELLTSFIIDDIKADKLHRMLSFWSAEGRLKTDKLTDLNMEVSWAKHGRRVEKFGTVGSMPVRSYFPFAVLEDSESSEFIGVQLYNPGSWQMELISQRNDKYILAGGLADRDFGHWTKKLKPGETYNAPKAVIATGKSLLEVCDLLVNEQTPDISAIDNDMGVTFNEYCTTWGDPSIENLKRIADKIADKGIQYLVMDSGWYLEKGQMWWDYVGKWEVNKDRFPNGLKELSDYIRSKGMIPGIWFEPESVSWGSEIYDMPEHLVKKDGIALNVGGKKFLDMEDPWVRAHLQNKVIKLLKDNNFGYIKIDYNDTIGIGCDGEDGLAENLRRKLLATQDFFKELKQNIPELVIENCSSGGHRLEPSMMELASMASFSDAHETLAIPLIAANLHRVVKPEQNQIWSVLRKEDSISRIYFSLCSTFLGRMGLSGDIYDLSDAQWACIDEGIAFYKNVSHIIKNGSTVLIDTNVESYNNPEGYQIVIRKLNDTALVIAHRFGNDSELSSKLEHILSGKTVLQEYGSIDTPFSAKAILYK